MPFICTTLRSLRRGMRVLSAGKSRLLKFLLLPASASVQLYVSFRPPKARSRVRLVAAAARLVPLIASTSSPAPLRPAAGRVLLPQPDSQFI